MAQNSDDLFNTNIKGLLALVCDLANDYFNDVKSIIKEEEVILCIPAIATFTFSCNYTNKECYLKTNKNGYNYKLIIPVQKQTPINKDYFEVMIDVFSDNFNVMYENIEKLSLPNHFTTLPYSIIKE